MSKRRWYDHDEDLSKAIEFLAKFPDTIQDIISEGACQMAEKQFNAHQRISQLKTLGSEKVLALFKSKKKQRYLDANPNTHKIMGYLSILSIENRRFLCFKIAELSEITTDYLISCSQLEQKAEVAHIQGMKEQYVEKGRTFADDYLKELKAQFLRELRSKTASKRLNQSKTTIDESMIRSSD